MTDIPLKEIREMMILLRSIAASLESIAASLDTVSGAIFKGSDGKPYARVIDPDRHG